MRKIILILWLCAANAAQAQTEAAAPTVEQKLEVGHGERLLILAPHPDDESLSAAGLAKRVLENNGSVRSVVVTSGDAYVGAVILETGKRNPTAADYLDFGIKRLQESEHAAQLLGDGKIHLDLLGFSDGVIYDALISHWRRHWPWRSDYTGFDHVPYSEAEDRGRAQDGQDIRDQLLAILRETQPTLIAFPDVMENDSDHAALGMFTLLTVHEWMLQQPTVPAPRLLAYLIHWQNGWPTGSNWGHAADWRNQPMHLPADLPLRGHTQVCLALTPQETDLKQAVMAEYHSQQQIMADFLSSFVRSSECFTQLKPHDTLKIEGVLEHWRHVRKVFDNHPLTRRKL
jgi:LmbE family N-acetylglucosaminyl deacetylase